MRAGEWTDTTPPSLELEPRVNRCPQTTSPPHLIPCEQHTCKNASIDLDRPCFTSKLVECPELTHSLGGPVLCALGRGKRKSSSKPQTGKKGPPPLGMSLLLLLVLLVSRD